MNDIESFIDKNRTAIVTDPYAFAQYMRSTFKEKQISQQEVFLYADIPERYGYKLISQEKHTLQRDIILRICYAAHFTLEEVQKALRLYKMPELYHEYKRDIVLMHIFETRPGNILDVNELLVNNGLDPLRSSGRLD